VNTFQDRCKEWAVECFGQPLATEDMKERAQRFMEEAAELTQAVGMTREQAHALVDWKYDGARGTIADEVGGVLITLALLCETYNLDMERVGEGILQSCWARADKIKAKQKTKPRF
jgi:NTP pyrophosphatase (non-canonical NTP hydrolase)